ncbi:hypothetical protein RB213_010962 [Colletotrichum asianum]
MFRSPRRSRLRLGGFHYLIHWFLASTALFTVRDHGFPLLPSAPIGRVSPSAAGVGRDWPPSGPPKRAAGTHRTTLQTDHTQPPRPPNGPAVPSGILPSTAAFDAATNHTLDSR